MFKRSLILALIFSMAFTGVAFASSSASYKGNFHTSVTTISSINVNNGVIYARHHQSNTSGRTVKVEAMRKGSLGYSSEKVMGYVRNDTPVAGYSLSANVRNGEYKLKFSVSSIGNCTGGHCGNIYINGTFSR